MDTFEIKTVFLSYCWTTEKHQDWVLELAQRLIQDGVDVKLDKWDLNEGHDKFAFMESMVTSPTIDKVLIILDKKYSEKADERQGGVGTETLIITAKVYGDVKQDKFIPIVAETDEEGTAYLPSYLSGRIYIDLSSDENLERNYEQLLRNIYNRPSQTKPKLGKPPKYLTEDTSMQFKTTTITKGFDAQINRHPNRINSILQDFTEEYFSNLSEFVMSDYVQATVEDIGKAVLSILHQYQPLRNDYAQILDKTLKSNLPFQPEIFLNLLEKIPILFDPLDTNKMTWRPFRYNHFRLIAHELFLYTVAIGLKNNNYTFLEELFYHRYLIREGRNRMNEPQSFAVLRFHYEDLDEYYKKLKDKNYFSVQAEIITSQAYDLVSKELLVKSDMLCHYIAKLNNHDWFPITYVYGDSYSNGFEFFTRLVSKKYCDKIKNVLGIDSVEELKQKIKSINEQGRERGYNSGFTRASTIPMLSTFVNVESIGSAR
jgi:hypothetical protein